MWRPALIRYALLRPRRCAIVWARVAASCVISALTLACSPGVPQGATSSEAPIAFAPFVEPLRPAPADQPSIAYQSLDWPQFDVSAHLDRTGVLHVRERQVMRFTGDWNGGERIFTVRFGQRFEFDRLLRVDSLLGVEIPLDGDRIEHVDGYQWADARTLRWRSRQTDDGPFHNTYLTYILEYRYLDILTHTRDGYVLDHEFAFRDRTGDIERFSLVLTLDSVWQAPPDFAGRWQEGRLEPGVSFVVNTTLAFRGSGQPSNVVRGAAPVVSLAFVAMITLGLLGLTVRFMRDERALGRFARVETDSIDEAWLERHVFIMLPEVLATAWDDSVGPPAVTATVARLVTEGTLSSAVKAEGWGPFRWQVLHLQLEVRRETLASHERALVHGLFESHKRTTDSRSLRKRYQFIGFDPASLIRAELERQLAALPESGGAAPVVRRWPMTMALHGLGLLLFVLAMRARDVDALLILGGFGVGLVLWLVGVSQARAWRRRVVRPGWHLVRVLLPVLALAGGLAWLATQVQLAAGPLTFAALTAFGLGFGASVLDAARSPHTRARMLLRRRLVAARQYFARQLASPEPQLEQAWYPYLLALGLHRQVTRWFKAFGAPDAARPHGRSAASRQSGGVARATDAMRGDRSWGSFGGGGGFAGAGATVAFGAAVRGFSAGVTAPSSSTSGSGRSAGGGGRSSSGGRSGGGGGGGW